MLHYYILALPSTLVSLEMIISFSEGYDGEYESVQVIFCVIFGVLGMVLTSLISLVPNLWSNTVADQGKLSTTSYTETNLVLGYKLFIGIMVLILQRFATAGSA